MKKTLLITLLCLAASVHSMANEVSQSSIDGTLSTSCGNGAAGSDCRSNMVMITLTSIGAPTVLTANISDSISNRTFKLMAQAKEDAQTFVATDGEIFGAELAAAVNALSKELPHGYTASTMQIAEAIIGM